jgi:WhiB family redox-sensing transcriptional regulator
MTRRLNPGAAAGPSLSGSSTLGWQEQAACRGEDPDLFFAPAVPDDATLPELGALAAEWKRREAAARRICASCPVRTACLDWRLRFEHQRDGGIWGGLDEEQRWKLHRNRVRAASARRRAA